MKLRLIDTGYNTPSMNMAIDEALLTSKLPVLRLYGWKPAGLSIGYFQSTKDLNFKNLKKHKIDLVRRLTGGDAVLHDKELTYSFIIDEDLMPKEVIESYKIISKGILTALDIIGLKAKMNQETKKNKKSAICFINPSYYELVINNKKIVGSAQKRINGKLLQHGSVLLDIDIKKLTSLFNINTLINDKITSINKELNKKINYNDLAKAMEKGFKGNFKANIIKDKLTDKELALAEKLNIKYSTKNWNENR